MEFLQNISLGLKPNILSVLLTGELSTFSLVSIHAGELVGEGDPNLLWMLFNSKELHSLMEVVASTKYDLFRFTFRFIREVCRHTVCVSIAFRVDILIYCTYAGKIHFLGCGY